MESPNLGAFFGVVGLVLASIAVICYGLYRLVIALINNRKPACSPTLTWDSRWNGFIPSADFVNNPTTYARNALIYANKSATFVVNFASMASNSDTYGQNSPILAQPSSIVLNPSSLTGNSSFQTLSSQMEAFAAQNCLERAGSSASNYSYSEALFAINRTQVGAGEERSVDGRTESRPDGSTSLALSMYDLMMSNDNLQNIPACSNEPRMDDFRQGCCYNCFSWKKNTEESHNFDEPVILKLEMKPENGVSVEGAQTYISNMPTNSSTNVGKNLPVEDATHTALLSAGNDETDRHRILDDVSPGHVLTNSKWDSSLSISKLPQQEYFDGKLPLKCSEHTDNAPLPLIGETIGQNVSDEHIGCGSKNSQDKCEPSKTESSKVHITANTGTHFITHLDKQTGNLAQRRKEYDPSDGNTEFQKQNKGALLQTEIDVNPATDGKVPLNTVKESSNNSSFTEKTTRRSRKRLHRHAVSQTSITAKPTDLDAANKGLQQSTSVSSLKPTDLDAVQRSLHQSTSVSSLYNRNSMYPRDFPSRSFRESSQRSTTKEARELFGSKKDILSREASSSSGSSIDSTASTNREQPFQDLRSNSIFVSTRSSCDAEAKRIETIAVSRPTDLDEVNLHAVSGGNCSNADVRLPSQLSCLNIGTENNIPDVHLPKPNSSTTKILSVTYL